MMSELSLIKREDYSNRETFAPEILDKTVIAMPLLEMLQLEEKKTELDAKSPLTPEEQAELEKIVAYMEKKQLEFPMSYDVIIDLNLMFPQGRRKAAVRVRKILDIISEQENDVTSRKSWINEAKSAYSQQYLFGKLPLQIIYQLVQRDGYKNPAVMTKETEIDISKRAIYRIWPDFKVRSLTTKSISTVKADAARVSFSAMGKGIVWAVMDSGINAAHPHFDMHENLKLPSNLQHKDFTEERKPNVDEFGHGTHVAGIIAGEQKGERAAATGQTTKEGDTATSQKTTPARKASGKSRAASEESPLRAYARHRDARGDISYEKVEIEAISGMAPQCKLLSLKVLDKQGEGMASNLIAAIEYIQEENGYGRRLHIHGVNMSVGYDFEPEWFACGQSPLCVEVDRLVRSGVVVVVAAGNTGYGWAQTTFRGAVAAGMNLTINDPGNAELAITVGSTHRDMPHVYGVSYFSSKGPTGDGRCKPDLVAPGEKIISCAAGKRLEELKNQNMDCEYLEESGTSMAAPHVSGTIAAFLSVRSEFIGQPEKVKEIFLSTATDLKRERYFQGHGLVDLMRAIQSV
jgi:serine protease AprX